jgi:hypothetical protein
LIDWRPVATGTALPIRANASTALSFELHEPLQSLHQFGEPEPSLADSAGEENTLNSFADAVLPAPSSLVQVADLQAAVAKIDLHSLRSSESGLLAVGIHLRAIQQRIAILRARGLVESADAAKHLGFCSLTIVCGRGAGSSTQGYSPMRLVVFEALVRLGIAPIARANTSMLVGGADRSVASAVDSVTIDSVDLWQWCVANSGRLITLNWQRPPPPPL